jgi:hypothetical protein
VVGHGVIEIISVGVTVDLAVGVAVDLAVGVAVGLPSARVGVTVALTVALL